jgi:hypothetical protein
MLVYIYIYDWFIVFRAGPDNTADVIILSIKTTCNIIVVYA